jgi:hypothetical protein
MTAAVAGNKRHAPPDSASTAVASGCRSSDAATPPASNKRHKPPGPEEESNARFETNMQCFDSLDDNCRLRVYSFLTWQDLGRASATSKAFREGCRHPSLKQNADRQAVLHVGECPDRFFSLLAEGAVLNQFATYPKLKIVRGAKLASFSRSTLREPARTIPGITSLEISFDSTPRTTRGTAPGSRQLWQAIAACLPNLRHLTVSDERLTELAHVRFAGACPRLETLTFHRQTASNLMWGFGHSQRLRAIYMDDCTFRIDSRVDYALVDDGRSRRFIFDVDAQLERLSIRNARFYYYVGYQNRVDDRSNARDLPQEAIVKFVRRATHLKWLRSNLTAENVTMLQRERPDVTFES